MTLKEGLTLLAQLQVQNPSYFWGVHITQKHWNKPAQVSGLAVNLHLFIQEKEQQARKGPEEAPAS